MRKPNRLWVCEACRRSNLATIVLDEAKSGRLWLASDRSLSYLFGVSPVAYTLTRPQCSLGCLLISSLLLTGCGREDVQVYRVAKEQKTAAAGHEHHAGDGHDHGQEAAVPALTWKLPGKNWEEAPAGEMRAASFRVKGEGSKQADVGVFPLPGMAGSDLSNVNRWRGQVGLPAVTEDELAKLAEAIEIDGSKAQVYDMAGENPGSGEKTRILAAILRKNNVAWFFKMTGDDALVAGEKKAFMSFLGSVKFQGAAAAASLPPDHPPLGGGTGTLPPDHPPIGGAAAAPAATDATEGAPDWQVPSGWKAASPGQFLVAKYTLAGEGSAQAAVNVSMSKGDGGGIVGNVNRWRRQVGLDEKPEDGLGLKSIDVDGGKATLVDISGTDSRTSQKARIIGAVVLRKDETWFYKLMGDEPVVAREKDAFLKFVQSAKYPNASR